MRTLGRMAITAIGSGDVSLARSASRGVDARELERTTHRTLTLGVTVIDVHPEADAERLVGDAIRTLRLRDGVVVSVQVPRLVEHVTHDALHERLPAGYVQERIEAALRATRLEVLPLAVLDLDPVWRTSSAWAELVGTCERLEREGKVMRWGARVDLVDPSEALDALIAEPWIAALSVPYSLCDRAAAATMAAMIQRDGVVFARRPLAGGALTGLVGPGVQLTRTDDRRALDDAALVKIAVEIAQLSLLARHTPPAATSCAGAKAALERGRRPDEVECATVAELALRFVIDAGAIALPRLHRDGASVDEAIVAAGARPLSAGLRDLLSPAPPPDPEPR